jgi:hypothetical protein
MSIALFLALGALASPVAVDPTALASGTPAGPADDTRTPIPEMGEPPMRRRARGTAQRRARLRAHLSRTVSRSARMIDHGVLELALAGGHPHLYRVEAKLGLLDHFAGGVAAHWLPGQSTPQVVPSITAAFFRGAIIEVGAHYDQTLHPPPTAAPAADETAWPRRTHWIFGTLGVTTRPVFAGVDLGVAHVRQAASPDPEADPTAYVRRVVAAGGLLLRLGNRRLGATAAVRAAPAPFTEVFVEVRLDVRFGLFELRPRGGWGDG